MREGPVLGSSPAAAVLMRSAGAGRSTSRPSSTAACFSCCCSPLRKQRSRVSSLITVKGLPLQPPYPPYPRQNQRTHSAHVNNNRNNEAKCHYLDTKKKKKKNKKKTRHSDVSISDIEIGAAAPDIPARSFSQEMQLWTYYGEDCTSYWHFFKLPFYPFAFPNIVKPGFIFAIACTAGIVSFNAISEIMTAPTHHWSTTSTALLSLSALLGAVIGYMTS
ncbi:uncharacterized protein IWZ02DRAFT_169943 [Phyllosticta citriasiana]|uniref:uncharacterized protein n=1 Tax=Phyllosticta citriasiana TaxID=595635 RepID=UPI0030FD9C7C